MEAVLGSDAGRVGEAMTEHLPECTYYRQVRPKQCICTEVKRAEQRVRDEIAADGPWFRSVVHKCCEDKQTAYAAALDAAEEAVRAALGADERNLHAELTALAAIDALKEKT